MSWSKLPTLLCGLVAATSGCKSAAPGSDTLAPRDVALDHVVAVDASRDMGPEASLDSGLQVRDLTFDFPQTDARLAGATALYLVADDENAFGLRRVQTDGSSSPKPVPGFSGLVDFSPIEVARRKSLLPIDATRASSSDEGPFQHLRLPDGSRIYRFHRSLTSTSGLVRAASGGAVEVLVEVPGLYDETISPQVALSRDNKLGAVVVDRARSLMLFGVEAGLELGARSVTLAPPAKYTSLESRSVTIAGKWVFCVGQSANAQFALLRASVEGAGARALEEVVLPPSGGDVPTVVGVDLTTSDDGQSLVARAGSSADGKLELYRIDVSTGQATKLTQGPSAISPRGDRGGPGGGRIAISPTGKFIAYVERNNLTDELVVRSVDKPSQSVVVTSAQRFQIQVSSIFELRFVTDEQLLFMAGETSRQVDLYRWDTKANTLENLSRPQAPRPYDGRGMLDLRALWISPRREWIYWITDIPAERSIDLQGVELANGRARNFTRGRRIEPYRDELAMCPDDGTIYFVARPDPKRPQEEIWRVVQDQQGPAEQMTAMGIGGPWVVRQLKLESGCGRLLFTAGGRSDLRRVWSLSTATPGSERPINVVPQFVGSELAASVDGSTVVFGSGGTAATMTLKSILSVGSRTTTIDTTPGMVHLMGVSGP